jgi:hypothetical protein
MSWLAWGPELANTRLLPAKLILLVPPAIPLKVTVATNWAPVTAGIAPLSIWTDPPPPLVAALIEKAEDEVTLIYCSTLWL